MASHALLLGTTRFADTRLAALNAPANDVQALANVLNDKARGGFDTVAVAIDADFLTVRDRLWALFAKRRPDDLLLLFYSGHGVLGPGNRLLLATPDTDLDQPGARSVAAAEIRDLMDGCRAERQVLILDCCHSGAFAAGAKAAGPVPAVTAGTFGATADAGATGRYVLTASDAQQFAWDGNRLADGNAGARGLSHFTGYLVDGIGRGQAAPDEPDITMDALFRYIDRRTREDGSPATPQRFVSGASGEFVIARNPLAAGPAEVAALAAGLANADWQVRFDAARSLAALARKPRTRTAARDAMADALAGERDFKVRSELMTGLGVAPEPDPPPRQPEPQRPDPPPPVYPRPDPVPLELPAAQAAWTAREAKALRYGQWMFGASWLLIFVDFGLLSVLDDAKVRPASALLLMVLQVGMAVAQLRWNVLVQEVHPPPGVQARLRLTKSGLFTYERRWFRRSLWVMFWVSLFWCIFLIGPMTSQR